jgi:hypothetical protein
MVRTHGWLARGWWALGLLLCGACGGETEAPFGEPEPEDPFDKYPPAELSPGNAVAFSGASAPAMLGAGMAPLLIAAIDGDPDCPRVTEGTTAIYEGGCTRDDGSQIFGRATVTESAEGGGTIRYEAFVTGRRRRATPSK